MVYLITSRSMLKITKSLFVEYLDYPKRTWWKVNDPVKYKKIAKLDNEENEQYMLRLGQVVEDTVKDYLEKKHNACAIDLLPDYKKKDLSEEEEDWDDSVFENPVFDHTQAIQKTIHAIHDKEPILYQPTFVSGNYFVRADFMVGNTDGSYNLIEVKETTCIRKDITDDEDMGKSYTRNRVIFIYC